MSAEPAVDHPTGTWITVDHDRIRRLPARLLALWPGEMRPDSAVRVDAGRTGPRTTSASGPTTTSAPAQADPDGVWSDGIDPADPGVRALAAAGLGPGPIPPLPVKRSTIDILSAWLRGFAGELARARLRMSIVISSGHEIVHLELALVEASCWAVLALRGTDYSDVEDRQFLRRLGAAELAGIVEGLTHLVEDDCVLTLSALDGDGRSRLELLSRTSGTWTGPVLERSAGGVTVVAHTDRGPAAVRRLVAAVLTGLLPTRSSTMAPR